MKVQATVLLTLQAKSLAEAGAILDDVLTRGRERDDVDVGRVEVTTPPADRGVTLPRVPARISQAASPIPASRAPRNLRQLAWDREVSMWVERNTASSTRSNPIERA
jgi:hypothetical protein